MLEHPAASAVASEAVILAHWDAGASIEQIIAATAYRRERVEKVVEIFHTGPSPAELDARHALPFANAEHVARLTALQRRMAEEREAAMRRERKRDDQETREINAGLTAGIESLCKELLPGGWKEAHEYVAANIFDSGKGKSLSVHVGPGPLRGVWVDFANRDMKGLPLALVCHVACGGDWKEAYAWAREWLGMPDPRAEASADPEVKARIAAEREQRRQKMERDRIRREAEAAEQRENIRRSAVAGWQKAAVLSAGDPVLCHLAARGIDLAALYRASGQRPGAIRFNPALQYGMSPSEGPPAYRGPAMVAMVTALAGTHVATHRTWLGQGEAGRLPGGVVCPPGVWGKAGGELLGYNAKGKENDARKVLGLYTGAHIPIWKGEHRCPLKDIPEGTDIYVGEGVEDGLSAACAKPELRIIGGISVSNLAELDLPPQMGRLIFLRQNDPPGSDADKAFQAAKAAHRERGRRVAEVRVGHG